MDENFEHILDALPEKRSRSRLDPYSALIKELLRRHRTYREIATILVNRFEVHASISTIHDFVRRWSAPIGKAAKTRMNGVQQNARKDQAMTSARMPTPQAGRPVTNDEVQKRIAALKSRPIPATEAEIFHYDPEKPLNIPSPTPRKKSDE